MSIKNIFFDFGGILLDLDYSATDNALKSLFNIDMPGREYPPSFQSIMDDYEMGKMNEDQFVHKLQERSDDPPRKTEILAAWNAMLLSLPIDKLEWVRSLRDDYRVFLLSNTNYTHMAHVFAQMIPAYNPASFEKSFFDKTFYSHLCGMRKPNIDIYQYVLQASGKHGSESLFIDDSRANVEGARQAGMNAVWHDPKTDIRQKLAEYLG